MFDYYALLSEIFSASSTDKLKSEDPDFPFFPFPLGFEHFTTTNQLSHFGHVLNAPLVSNCVIVLSIV